MKIQIDRREDSQFNKRAQRIKALLLDETNYADVYTPFTEENIEISQLLIGDIVYGNVCIEIKEGEDLINSINDKHIFEQIDNMNSNYKHNFLIIIGSRDEIKSYCKPKIIWKNGKKIITKPVTLKSIDGICASFRIRKEIHVESYLTLEDAITAIIPILFKGNDEKIAEIKAIRKQFTKSDEQVNVLISYAGISEKKAKALLEKFGTIRNIINADLKDLKEVDGIGTKLASTIINVNSTIFKGE